MKKKLLIILIAAQVTNIYFFAAIISPPILSVSISCNSYSCLVACNQSTGSLTANPNNGTPPYTYLWSTSATTQTISNLPVGVYTVTVYDAMGDSANTTQSISNQNTLNAAIVAIPYTIFPCQNQCTGWIRYDSYYLLGTAPYTVTVSSGTVNYNPQYPSGAAFTIENICDGANLAVNVTDALGCTGYDSSSFYSGFSGPNDFNPALNITPACSSMPNGAVEITNTPTTWYWSYMLKLTTDTNTAYNPNDLSDWTLYSSTFNNLLPGTYYLGIIYNYTYPADVYPLGCYDYTYCYHGCPRYVPVTVPDLGPNCSTVEGDVFVDLNANCTEDVGEIGVPNTIIEFTPGPYYAYTDASGHYSSNLIWGNYNMTHYPPAALTQLCPANPFPISLSSINTSDTVNFADTSNIPFDISAFISHGTAHPGFNFSYGVSVSNLSYTPSGSLTVTLNYDPLLSFVSANPSPFSTSSGQVVWQLSSITNFQSTWASVTLSVPPNPALIGDTLTASVTVSATTPETNLANNVASTWQIITGSFDPNEKTVEQPASAFIPATQGLFNYTIQFQNTGIDTAFNIEVIDTLDSDLNVTTFVPGASSHPYNTDITAQDVIHFYFNNIFLSDSTTDVPHTPGFVSFQIHSKANLPHGTAINNTANIVFDFNPPVATNTTQNTVDLTLSINSTAATICAGQSVTLTMIPELQNTPWKWRAGSCSASIIGSGNSITVSPPVTTTYFVRDSAGTIPVGSCYRKTIIVNPSTSAVITPNGPTTFCAGNSVTLTANASNGYWWSDNSTTQSINVTTSGNYLVTVTNANNCTASSWVSVTVNPLPTASVTPGGPTTFCQGNSVTLTSNAASSYLWSNNSISQSINVTSSGNYVVTVTDANNCSSASPATTVTVNPNPSVPAITPSGDSLISDAANGYQWYFNSAMIPWATLQSYHPTQYGHYSVVITDANNCTASSIDYPFILTEVANLIDNNDLFIYPNPVDNELVVRSSAFGDKSEIIIYN